MRDNRVESFFRWAEWVAMGVYIAIAFYFGWVLLTPALPNPWVVGATMSFAVVSITLSFMEMDWKKRQRAEQIRRGCCQKCGYDIGVRGASVCPECGAEQTATESA